MAIPELEAEGSLNTRLLHQASKLYPPKSHIAQSNQEKSKLDNSRKA